MTADLDRKILVTGATGNVGRLVVDELLARGATNVRALTNDPVKAALPDGVEVAEGYLGRLSTMPAALDGVEVLYLAPLPRTVQDVVALVKQAGVRYVVDLSSSEADAEAAEGEHGWFYYAVEKAVQDSGLDWTHLRPGEFMTNTLDWAEQVRTAGVVRQWCGGAASAMIALEDIAAVAATVLLEDGHVGEKYEMTGPEAISRAERVRIIGEVLGKPVRFEEQPYEEAFEQFATAAGPDFARWYLDGMTQLAEVPQPVLSTIEDLTGNPAMTYRAWVTKHADAFR